LLELYNEISNQGKSFVNNLDYEIYIDYFLFLYAKLNGKRASPYYYYNPKVKKLYRILNNKIISNHFDSGRFRTNIGSLDIPKGTINKAHSGHLKQLCLIEICKYIRSLSIQPNRFISLIPVFEYTQNYLIYEMYRSERIILHTRMQQLIQAKNNIILPPPPKRILEIDQTISTLIIMSQDIQSYSKLTHVRLQYILKECKNIIELLKDCVQGEIAREQTEMKEHLESEKQKKLSTSGSNTLKRIDTTPGLVPRGQNVPHIEPLPKFSLGRGRQLTRKERIQQNRDVQIAPVAEQQQPWWNPVNGGRTRKKI
jgi:hypothetical protein